MSTSPDDNGGGMLLIEAVESLKASWNTGESSIGSIGNQLAGRSRLQTLLQLVLIDSELATAAKQICSTENYLSLFPELAPHRTTIETHITKLRENSKLDQDTNVTGLFSKASIAHTVDLVPQMPSEVSRSRVASTSLPESISNYRILQELGRGSFGQVLLAEDPRLDRKVAIKIQDKANSDCGLSDAFLHEARAIARLEHQNIVRLLHVDETTEGLGYLVYEYVSGTTLADRVKLGNYGIEQAVQWVVEIAGALDFAHRRGVIHRDVSPRNIMIDAAGIARLLDFGLSRLDDLFHTADQDCILGTPSFMSPEQASGKPHWATSYADLFSLGSVLYYALTRKVPFQGSSIFDVCERVQSATPPSPRSIQQDISPELEAVISKAMAKEPQARYSTGADFAKALQSTLNAKKPTVFQSQPSALPTWLIRTIALVLVLTGGGVSSWTWVSYQTKLQLYNDSLPKTELTKIGITIDREGLVKSELLSTEGKKLLPLQNEDLIQLFWTLKSGITSKTMPSILVFGEKDDQRKVLHPAPLEMYQLLATRSNPHDRLYPGKSFVLLCFAPKQLTVHDIKKLTSPWTTFENPLEEELICSVGNAPELMEQLKDLDFVKMRSTKAMTLRFFEINSQLKNELSIDHAVQTYFGVVIMREAADQ